MTKTLGVLFLMLLAIAHGIDPSSQVVHRPLSEFRDYGHAWIGYLLFCLLILVGAKASHAARRSGQTCDSFVYATSSMLLLFIALTPSYGLYHNLGAALGMVVMQIYFGHLLSRNDQHALLVFHFFVPLAILLISRGASYGIWQKTLVIYFLAATIFHESCLARSQMHGRRRKQKSSRNPAPSRLPRISTAEIDQPVTKTRYITF